MTLKEEIKFAAQMGWFLPSIDPKRFADLVQKELASIRSGQNSKCRMRALFHDFWCDFNPLSGRRIVIFDFGRKVCRETWIFLSENKSVMSVRFGEGSDGYYLNHLHAEWDETFSSPNPNLFTKNYPPDRTRFLNQCRFDSHGLYFFGVTKIPDHFWRYYRELAEINLSESPNFHAGVHAVNPSPKQCEWFEGFWTLSSAAYAAIENLNLHEPGWRSKWIMQEREREIKDAHEAFLLKRENAAKEMKDFRIRSLRNKRIRIRPTEILTAASTIMKYATQQK